MKLRSTTPVSKLLRISCLMLIAVGTISLSVGLSIQTTGAQTNTERQARIDELTKKIDEQVASTRGLNEQSSDLESQIAALKRERDYLQGELQKNQARQAALVTEMADVEVQIKQQQDALGQAMTDAYMQDTISPIEMLASSDSIADYIDSATMNEAVRARLRSAIGEVKTLKANLLAKQDEMRRIVGDQQNQALALDAKKADQEKMLVATNDATGKLAEITKEMAAERQALQQQQQSTLASVMAGAQQVAPGTVSQPVTKAPAPITPAAPVVPVPAPSTPSSPAPAPTPTPAPTPEPAPVVLPNGGYPSYLQNCYVDAYALSYGIDPWGYGCRQCVSYTAWKVLQRTGRTAMYWGNAKDWPASARRAGYATGSSPRAGSVGVMTTGPYGHVVWVESVNSNGTINISQYNYWLAGKSNGGWGWYSEFQNVSPWAYQVYIYT